jgi:hypothetical protein
MRLLAFLLTACTAAGCGGGGGGDGGDDGGDDGAADDGSADDGDPGEPPDLPAWEPGLPPSSVMEERRGLVPRRGIIHLHSPYSHDACDGEPRAADGTVNEECLQHLRDGLCATRMDYAALTDHDDSMADEPWGGELFLSRDGDVLVPSEVDGLPIASRMACPDGHEVLLGVGGENDLMPIFLDRHPDGDAQARHDAYNSNDAAAVAGFRALGGLVWVAHSESRDVAELAALGLDGMEIFNLHAAIDPDIREKYLGLDGAEALQRAFEFAGQDPAGPEPDLAILAFMEPHVPSIDRWETLLRGGARVVGSAGTDAHENALPIAFRDGERGDSYRRTLRWFSNVVLVDAASADDPIALQDALAGGRAFVVFEILGTPVGFDMWADRDGGDPLEIGGEASVGEAVTITATTPTVHGLSSPDLPEPTIRTVILRIPDSDGETVELASGDGEVSAPADQPGAYRVEVRIIPRHLGPYLGSLGPKLAESERVWIYSNPIYIRP